MNQKWVAFHVGQAIEDLSRMLIEIQSQPDYDEGEFQIAITHAYSHLNTAWNSRNVDDAAAASVSEHEFNEWIRFPRDLAFLTDK